ncbi:thiol peroxidase [Levilactobacillus bambusae]|uniref:Thiol peroxidase n=1 Tax=Levilactobacillus bambusae TaxID=2024736 RepID=A0A2V1MZP4_9LACO|nr:thiol peroxidase [Levilactobacillus bambusae]PWF99559.1 thiol peroxidase [Levilactobacillus bambusae]
MQVTVEGKSVSLVGNPPEIGTQLPKFKLWDKDDQKVKTANLLGTLTLISVVPDINTSVCTMQTRKFNQQADHFPGAHFITVSTNTIAEQAGWCAAQGVQNLDVLSDADESFGYAMELLIPDTGTLARSVWIVDANGQIVYRQIVPEEVDEPNYLDALNELEKLTSRVDDN